MTNDAASPLHLEDLKKFDLPVLASGLKVCFSLLEKERP